MPWLGPGFIYCVHEEATVRLQEELGHLGFTEVVLDGARMSDAAGFHGEVKRAFRFPDYYGRNWDAFNECFGETRFSHPTAITWRSAEQLAAANLKTFVEAVAVLRGFQDAFADPDPDLVDVSEPTQIEVFLTGRGAAFRRPEDPPEPGWAMRD